jgi:hypothetical protein
MVFYCSLALRNVQMFLISRQYNKLKVNVVRNSQVLVRE